MALWLNGIPLNGYPVELNVPRKRSGGPLALARACAPSRTAVRELFPPARVPPVFRRFGMERVRLFTAAILFAGAALTGAPAPLAAQEFRFSAPGFEVEVRRDPAHDGYYGYYRLKDGERHYYGYGYFRAKEKSAEADAPDSNAPTDNAPGDAPKNGAPTNDCPPQWHRQDGTCRPQ
jgi:hypothetical protein